ncbi:hypothetical protein SLEP1_g30981 [Rubroshorea leprosula]|uniref:Uncharacterized protein n=1 Tax=Rubroshorea leprosula TaxID=152421 RepID=A0AAV5KA69_9ROSI|nr:hypothetical protein SLEP1_g30981 [Rubroshorea leprosula]
MLSGPQILTFGSIIKLKGRNIFFYLEKGFDNFQKYLAFPLDTHGSPVCPSYVISLIPSFKTCINLKLHT